MASSLSTWNEGIEMNKIFKAEQLKQDAHLISGTNKKLVLAGGCFDILHVGHIAFLEKAKEQGDLLCILLESDESIRKSKGEKRPVNTQKDRAKLLSALEMVDTIIELEPNMSNADYDALVFALKPAIIATTKGDKNRIHKERQANNINAQVIDVVDNVENQSTTHVFKILQEL